MGPTKIGGLNTLCAHNKEIKKGLTMHTCDTLVHKHVKRHDQIASVARMPVCAQLQGCMLK